MKKFLTILLATLLVFNSAFTSKLWAEDEVSDEEETVEEVVSEEAEDVAEEEIVEVSELPMADENAAPTVTVVENTKGLLITATGDNAEDFIDLIYKGNMTNELEPDENGYTWHEYSIVYFNGPVQGCAQNEFNIFEDHSYSNIRFERVEGSSTKLLLPKAMYVETLLEGTYTITFQTWDAYGEVDVEGVAIHTGLTASDYGLKIVDSATDINVEYTVNARVGKKIDKSVTIISATGVIDGVVTDITSCIKPIVVYWNEDEEIWSNVKYHNMHAYQDGVQYALVLDYKYVYEDLENSIGFSSTHEYPNFIVNGTLVPTMDKEDAYDIFDYEWNPGVQVYYSDDELYMLDMEVGEALIPTATITETKNGILIELAGEEAEEWVNNLYYGYAYIEERESFEEFGHITFIGDMRGGFLNFRPEDSAEATTPITKVNSTTLLIPKREYKERMIDGTYSFKLENDSNGFSIKVNDVHITTGKDPSAFGPTLADEGSTVEFEAIVNPCFGRNIYDTVRDMTVYAVVDGVRTDVSDLCGYFYEVYTNDPWTGELNWIDVNAVSEDGCFKPGEQYRLVALYGFVLPDFSDPYADYSGHVNMTINGEEANPYIPESYGVSGGLGAWSVYSGELYFSIEVEVKEESFVVTYSGVEDGEHTNPAIVKGSDVVELAPASRNGYTFGGWYSDAKFTKPVTELSHITSDLTLYAKFTPNTLVIHFDGNGATGTMKDMNLVYDKSAPLTANAFKMAGYAFVGWADDFGNTYENKESVLNLHDVLFAHGFDAAANNLEYTLHAQWKILAQDVQIKYDDNYVNTETVGFEMGTMHTFQLDIDVIAEGATPSQDVVWKSSNVKVAVVDEDGNVTVTGLKGSAKITATATDGSKKSASFTVNCGRLVDSLVIEGPSGVASGKTIKLTAVVGPSDATSKKVNWSTGYSSFIKVKGGKVTAVKGITEPKQVMVIANAADGSGVMAVKEITVYPASEKTSIIMNGEDVTSTSIHIDPEDVQEFDLSAMILPTNASQGVTWKSSKPAILEVDENGHVTVHDSLLKSYKITVTATSSDGCKKAGKVTFVVSKYVHELYLNAPSNDMLSGTSMMLTPEFGLVIPTNQKLSWTSSDESLAKVKGGKVVALAGASGEVTITATALDGSGVSASKTITILPPSEYFAATNPFNLDYNAGYLKMTVKNASNGMVYGVEELKNYDEDEERQYLMGGDGVLRCNGQDSKGYLSLELYWDSDYMFNEFKVLVDNPTNFSVKVPGKMLDYSSSTSKYVSVTYLLTFEYIEY